MPSQPPSAPRPQESAELSTKSRAGSRSRHPRRASLTACLCVALAAATLPPGARAAAAPGELTGTPGDPQGTPSAAKASSAGAEAAYHPGKFVYAQLTTPDLAKAKAFYGPLLGWSFRDQPVRTGRYAEALVGDHAVAGLVERPLPEGNNPPLPLWLPFISTPDIRSVGKTARHYGAHILFPPRSIPGRGEQAILTDPQGAVFAILRLPKSDGSDSTPTTQGDWIWNALISPAPLNSAGFYQTVFGYQVQAPPLPGPAQRFILSSQNFARASVNPLPPRLPAGSAARWISFVQVDNVGATAEKAVQLGGSVVVEPHLDHQNCMIALLADPAGAVFGIMEWHAAECHDPATEAAAMPAPRNAPENAPGSAPGNAPQTSQDGDAK